jgi:hypothetical protein
MLLTLSCTPGSFGTGKWLKPSTAARVEPADASAPDWHIVCTKIEA